MNKKCKTPTASPLPFQGQKRMWVQKFREIINDYDDNFIFVDLFGGSGLLSHITKQHYPAATVIYNDYDDFHVRLANIERTNAIITDLRELLKDVPDDTKIQGDLREKLIKRLEQERGYVDWITISANILFSLNYCNSLETLRKDSLYKKIRKSNYTSNGYLEGVEIVKLDYKQLFKQYKDKENVVFIVDPPYLSTDVSSYKPNYWKLKDYLDVLNVLKDTNYIYFTSEKSSILELTEWLAANLNATDPFADAKKQTFKTRVSSKNGYLDIMLSKSNSKPRHCK